MREEDVRELLQPQSLLLRRPCRRRDPSDVVRTSLHNSKFNPLKLHFAGLDGTFLDVKKSPTIAIIVSHSKSLYEILCLTLLIALLWHPIASERHL